MKFQKKSPNEMSITTQTVDDIWTVYKIVEAGDIVSGQTIRKIKIGDNTVDRNVKTIKKHVFLSITVEKTEYEAHLSSLRITGPILEGTADVQKGEYHSFDVTEQTTITITKPTAWTTQQLTTLEQSTHPSQKTAIVLFDRDTAIFAKLTKTGFGIIKKEIGNVQKKTDAQIKTDDFFESISSQIDQLTQQYDTIIVSSSHFWKDYVLSKTKSKVHFIESSSVNESAIKEIINSKEFNSVVKHNSFSQNVRLIELLKKNLATNNLGTYGIEQITQAANCGAIEHVLISNTFMKKQQENGTFEEIENILHTISAQNGSIHFIEGEGEKDINALGGITAILRFEI